MTAPVRNAAFRAAIRNAMNLVPGEGRYPVLRLGPDVTLLCAGRAPLALFAPGAMRIRTGYAPLQTGVCRELAGRAVDIDPGFSPWYCLRARVTQVSGYQNLDLSPAMLDTELGRRQLAPGNQHRAGLDMLRDHFPTIDRLYRASPTFWRSLLAVSTAPDDMPEPARAGILSGINGPRRFYTDEESDPAGAEDGDRATTPDYEGPRCPDCGDPESISTNDDGEGYCDHCQYIY